VFLYLFVLAAAQEPAVEEPPPSDAPAEVRATEEAPKELSQEELDAINKALASDQAEKQQSGVPDLSKINIAAPLQQTVKGLTIDIGFNMDVAASYFSAQADQRGGHDPKETGFALQALEMSLGGSVDPFLRFDSNVVFSLFGVEIEEAYATTLALPANLQMRFGQFLTRFGRANPTHLHSWSFADQNLLIGKFFGTEGSRGLGAELSWLTPLPWYVELAGAVTNADGECCARSFLGADAIGIKTPLDLLGTFTLKQFFPVTDDWSLLVGASAQLGPNASGNLNRTEIYGVDATVRLRPLTSDTRWAVTWTTEAILRGRQVPFDNLYDGGVTSQIVWLMNQSWETGARYEFATGLENDPLDPEWTSIRHRGALQLTYYPSHFSRVRLQTSLDLPTYQYAFPVIAVFLTGEILVGAHAAHNY
jgi:hypothetical protein